MIERIRCKVVNCYLLIGSVLVDAANPSDVNLIYRRVGKLGFIGILRKKLGRERKHVLQTLRQKA